MIRAHIRPFRQRLVFNPRHRATGCRRVIGMGFQLEQRAFVGRLTAARPRLSEIRYLSQKLGALPLFCIFAGEFFILRLRHAFFVLFRVFRG